MNVLKHFPVPLLYALYFDHHGPLREALKMRISPLFFKLMNENNDGKLSVGNLVMKEVIELHGFECFIPFSDTADCCGFDNAAIVSKPEDGEGVILTFPFPDYEKFKDNKVVFNRKLSAIVATIGVFATSGNSFAADKWRSKDPQYTGQNQASQSFSLSLSYNGNWGISGVFSADLHRYFVQLSKNGENMRRGFVVMMMQRVWGIMGKEDELERFQLSSTEVGFLCLTAPGNACGINPSYADSENVKNLQKGYSFTDHNIDTVGQMIALIVGMAAITTCYYDYLNLN